LRPHLGSPLFPYTTLFRSCTLAFAEHRQIVIADVASHAFYAGTPALEALRAADVRALCATPLVTAAGKTLGIVATHFHEPKAPEDRKSTRLNSSHVAISYA